MQKRIIYFITGNSNKLVEAQSVIPEIERYDIDLPEIQEIDAHAIIKAKLLTYEPCMHIR